MEIKETPLTIILFGKFFHKNIIQQIGVNRALRITTFCIAKNGNAHSFGIYFPNHYSLGLGISEKLFFGCWSKS